MIKFQCSFCSKTSDWVPVYVKTKEYRDILDHFLRGWTFHDLNDEMTIFCGACSKGANDRAIEDFFTRFSTGTYEKPLLKLVKDDQE